MKMEQEAYRKCHGYLNSAFEGIKNIMDIQKSVLESPSPYKNYGNWNLCAFSAQHVENNYPAVEVKHGFKSYKSRGKECPILFDMNMTVKKGTIYSLLGSSGCGKTTLLGCIVGLKHLDSGEVLIAGQKGGPSHHSVPGRGVGYMPQDIALYGDFSIFETITYFGKLNGMKSSEVEESRKFLTELLSLPAQDRRVNTLSGGQARRVSIAVTLVHAPPLIILDEPTVGVDPLLRESIWQHLMGLAATKGTTIIVTTHYIEEAGHSNTVGVMRGGRLITEKSPTDLYAQYGSPNLQDCVLRLCHEDEISATTLPGRQRSKSSGNILTLEVEAEIEEALHGKSKQSLKKPEEPFCYDPDAVKRSFLRIKSLSVKNFYVMMRNLVLLGFVILMPAVQIVLMGMSMGNDPHPLRLGVVTNESCDFDPIFHSVSPPDEGDCIIANLSCRYLSTLPFDIVELSFYSTAEEAREQVVSGAIRGFMGFPENFSDYMFERSSGGFNIENETLIGSTISFQMDASNTVITKSLQRILYETYSKFVKGLLSDCGMNPELGGIPIKFDQPVYGEIEMELQQFVAAGMLVGVALFFPLASSTITYLWDKKQGTMERARVAGTHPWEILISYFLTEGTVLVLQTCLCLLIFVTVFQVTIVGSIFLAFALVALNGFAGISLGLLLASICREEIEAILLAMAIMMPNFFLAGAMWPTEAMPWVLQKLSLILPGTLGNEAFRSIVIRGWGFSHISVWGGFLSTTGWICFYWITNIYVQRFTSAKK